MRRDHSSSQATKPTLVRALLVALALGVCASPPTPAWAARPQESIRELITAVSAVLDNPALQGPASKDKRRERVAAIIRGTFHFEHMAQEALGAQWGRLTPVQQQEFTRLFGDRFQHSYSLLVLRYLGERKTNYVGESVQGRQALVETFLFSEKDGKLPVEYRLSPRGDRWLVEDVVVDGVSLTTNYRVQFSRIIRTSSYDTLLHRMRIQGE